MQYVILVTGLPYIHTFDRYFPHVVDIACQAVLDAITDMNYALEQADNFVPPEVQASNFVDALERDPVATIHSLIKEVCFHLFLLC